MTNNFGLEEIDIVNFDMEKLKIKTLVGEGDSGGNRKMNSIGKETALVGFDEMATKTRDNSVFDKQNVIIEFGYSVRILWSCSQHDHHWRFTAQLCHYFSELKRR